MENLKLLLITLLDLKGFGNKTVNKFIKFCGDNLPNSIETLKKNLNDFKKDLDIIEITKSWNNSINIINIAKENNIEIISIFDDIYPKLLKEIDSPPIILYLKGNSSLLNQKAIAVIGSRNHSKEAIEVTKKYSKALVNKNFIIVSGLAKGIDSIAHETTLKYSGNTIAILPTSLDNIYPIENINLANEIINNNGLLISEYPFKTKLNKYNFIQRNRIQSGISLGTFVVETSISGGSMKTAKFTLEQNHKLFVYVYKVKNRFNEGNFELLKNSKVIQVKDIDFIENI